jgi:ferredoxin
MVRIEVVAQDGRELFATEIPTAQAQDTLLDLLLNAGYEWPHGCRSGTCASCLAEVLDGSAMLPPRTFVENDTLTRIGAPANARLACRIGPVAGAQGTLRVRPQFA